MKYLHYFKISLKFKIKAPVAPPPQYKSEILTLASGCDRNNLCCKSSFASLNAGCVW
jgi:hypothetical protein